MDQNPQVFAGNAKLRADRVLILLFEEDGLEQPPILLIQLLKNLADETPGVLRLKDAERTGITIHEGAFRLVVDDGLALGLRPIVLEEHVVADRIDEGAETIRLAQRAFR